MHVVGVTEKWITLDAFIEYQHAYPARIDEAARQEAMRLAAAAVRAVGLDDCGFHVEVMLTRDGGKIVEVNGRLGGDFITSHLVPLGEGIDITRAAFQAALGDAFDLRPQWRKGACIHFLLAQKEGVVKRWAGVERMRELPGVREFGINKRVGDTVLLPKSFFDCRLCYLITQGDSTDEATQHAQAALAELRCEIEEGSI